MKSLVFHIWFWKTHKTLFWVLYVILTIVWAIVEYAFLGLYFGEDVLSCMIFAVLCAVPYTIVIISCFGQIYYARKAGYPWRIALFGDEKLRQKEREYKKHQRELRKYPRYTFDSPFGGNVIYE